MQFESVVNSLVHRPVESSPRFDVLYLLRFVKQGNGSVLAHCFTNLNSASSFCLVDDCFASTRKLFTGMEP